MNLIYNTAKCESIHYVVYIRLQHLVSNAANSKLVDMLNYEICFKNYYRLTGLLCIKFN
jgi:hypothetical protein